MLQLNQEETLITATIKGELDTITAPPIQTQLLKTIEDVQQDIIFDLSQLDYMASSGLRLFVQLQKTLATAGKEAVITCLKADIKTIFDISGLTPLFYFLDTTDEAREYIKDKNNG